VILAAGAGGYRDVRAPQHAKRARDANAAGSTLAADILRLGTTPLVVELIARWW
jgi:hypothetical protein